jgi:hypothetical protein
MARCGVSLRGVGMSYCSDGILFIASLTRCHIKAVNMKIIMNIIAAEFS